MKARSRLYAWAFLVVALLLFAAMVGLVSDYVRNRRVTRDMQSSLQRIDRLLEQADFDEAELLIRRAGDHAGSAAAWLRLMKRAWRVAQSTGRYAVFSELGQRATSMMPGNRDLQALATYGELQTGDYVRASERGATWLIGEPRYRTVAAEAYLRAGRAMRPEQQDSIAILTRVGRDSSVDELLEAESITADLRFRANAVLRSLEKGDMASAGTLADDLRFRRAFPLLTAYMLFDAGDFDGFFQNLGRVSDATVISEPTMMMTADVYLIREDYQDAARIYDELVSTAPDASAPGMELFLNRAWIAKHDAAVDGDPVEILRRGIAQHGETWDLRRPLVLELFQGDPPAARMELERAGEERRAAAALLGERLFATTREISPSIGSLWLLHERYPRDPAVRRFLAWFVAGVPQPGELNRLLSLYDSAGATDELAFYRGVAAVAEGDLDAALRHFSDSATRDGDWYGAVNAARIALEQRRGDAAEEMAQLARALHQGRDATQAEQANMAALEAAVHADRGRFAAAAGEAERALELDGGSVHARAVLRYLGARR